MLLLPSKGISIGCSNLNNCFCIVKEINDVLQIFLNVWKNIKMSKNVKNVQNIKNVKNVQKSYTSNSCTWFTIVKILIYKIWKYWFYNIIVISYYTIKLCIQKVVVVKISYFPFTSRRNLHEYSIDVDFEIQFLLAAKEKCLWKN